MSTFIAWAFAIALLVSLFGSACQFLIALIRHRSTVSKKAKKIIIGIGAYLFVLTFWHLCLPAQDIKMYGAQASVNIGAVEINRFRLHNGAYIDLKDPEITCNMKGPSGTTIKKASKTIYAILPAGRQTEFGPMYVGEAPEQATYAECYVSAASVRW